MTAGFRRVRGSREKICCRYYLGVLSMSDLVRFVLNWSHLDTHCRLKKICRLKVEEWRTPSQFTNSIILIASVRFGPHYKKCSIFAPSSRSTSIGAGNSLILVHFVLDSSNILIFNRSYLSPKKNIQLFKIRRRSNSARNEIKFTRTIRLVLQTSTAFKYPPK
jgi:hypothetical protein